MLELMVEMSSVSSGRKSSGRTFTPYCGAQLARNVAIDAAIVNVVRAAYENERGLVGAREFVERLGSGFQDGLIESHFEQHRLR